MFAAKHIPYKATNSFSKIVLDYLEGNEKLKPFFSYSPTLEGIQKAIEAKQKTAIDRRTLVEVLKEQYKPIENTEGVHRNLDLLLQENTFTICTAHQPNLFTGPLYFIYKILHAIRLAEYLKQQLHDYHFVPVFYMGCEDADLQELNHFTVAGKKYTWNTSQTGAVGRMKIDKELLSLISELEQQIGVDPYGPEWIDLLKKCFTPGKDIQTATFELVHQLFSTYGLVVLIPDNKALKKLAIPLFEDDLYHQTSSHIVANSSEQLSKHYNVQAHSREINLFYLEGNIRERIIKEGDHFKILNSEVKFSDSEMKEELNRYPERFSPNVILRGLFQEMILPNVVFIGGGGELAYWLQLKSLFDHYKVPFPVQVLRNSFLIIENHHQQNIDKLQLSTEDLFGSELSIMNKIIEREGKKPQLNGELEGLKKIYDELKLIASSVDPTLEQHVNALKTKTVNQLMELEKKLNRAERKKHQAKQQQILKLKKELFPNGGLQERVENMAGYYAKFGNSFINILYDNSPALEQNFTVLHQTD